MRIEQVTATAFGPLAGQTLHLAEGMTVVIGPNEAGKSTWHAAIFAALCGRRRGAGRPGEEAKFIDAYKPWEGSAWAVAARLVLDDGRRVEVRQDLANKVGSGATDLDLGIDLSNQIIFDGAPDAARWLGLDRKTFPSTASVRQAQLFSVLGGAEGLQEHLQRAAATAGTDATAAAALAAVTKFAAEHVGRNARNATKPWRVAEVAVETATRDLAAAQAAHRDYLARQEQVAAARAQAATATAVAECAAAAWARAQAEELAGRLDRARELAAQVGGVEPADASVDADLAGTVERALTRWSDRPADPDTDPDLAAVPAALATAQAQLAGLPGVEDGDQQVHPEVQAAADRLAGVRADADAHLRAAPRPVADELAPLLTGPLGGRMWVDRATGALTGPLSEVSDVELAELATVLERGPGHVEPDLAARAAAAEQAAAAPAGRSRNTPLLAVAAVLAVAGVAGLVLGAPVVGAVMVVVALALAGVGAAGRRGSVDPDTMRQAAVLAEQLRQSRERARAQDEALGLARARCGALGVPVVPAQLRALAATRAQAQSMLTAGIERQQRWDARAGELTGQVRSAAAALAAALAGHGQATVAAAPAPAGPAGTEMPGGPGAQLAAAVTALAGVDTALADYREGCRRRAGQAMAAAGRGELTEKIAALQGRLDAAARARQGLVGAAEQVLTAAAQVAGRPVGSGGGDGGALDAAARTGLLARAEQGAQALRDWRGAQALRVQEASAARRTWTQLQGVLGGLEVDTLAQRAVAAAQGAARADAEARAAVEAAVTAGMPAPALADWWAPPAGVGGGQGLSAELVTALRGQAADAGAHAAELSGALEHLASSLASVPAAEETLAAARAELDRVLRLRDTLTLTEEFLTRAQERVHRDIAPVLAATVTGALPRLTGGRYTEAVVDPTSLRVQVRRGAGGQLRLADALSHGTAEQVYLLLRVALAQHLTAGRGVCPLLLDDVTVHADTARTVAVLELLHELSADRQVVLFTQEDSVADWARANLTGPRDAVVSLLDPGLRHAGLGLVPVQASAQEDPQVAAVLAPEEVDGPAA